VYGMINEAMRRLVVEGEGTEVWGRVAARAESPESFAALAYYDDDVTYRLVDAASLELGTPATELLRKFGRYWSLRVGPENYGDILGATGTDVVSVLDNLDEMHARLQVLYPELRPPSFTVIEEGSATFEVRYSSEREGLAPFVLGLLEGLGELYGTPALVEQVPHVDQGHAGDVFRVTLET
jgi:Haem-NO-binding